MVAKTTTAKIHQVVQAQTADTGRLPMQVQRISWFPDEEDVEAAIWQSLDRALLDEVGFVSEHRLRLSFHQDEWPGGFPVLVAEDAEKYEGRVVMLDGPLAGEVHEYMGTRVMSYVVDGGSVARYEVHRIAPQGVWVGVFIGWETMPMVVR